MWLVYRKGRKYVTFNPRQADSHFYGGNYFNFGCDSASGAPQTPTCYAQDWAILIMAQNVWDRIEPKTGVPSYRPEILEMQVVANAEPL
jgi:hypothetical protein